MKKNIALAISFFLMLGTVAMADALTYDNIIAYGTSQGDLNKWDGVEHIFGTYVSADVTWKKNDTYTSINHTEPAANPSDTEISFWVGQNKHTPFEWTYIILAANNTGDWYLFENTHILDGADTFNILNADGDIIFTGDYLVTIPVLNTLIFAYDDGHMGANSKNGKPEEMSWTTFAMDGTNSLNQADITVWFGGRTISGGECEPDDWGFVDPSCMEPVPEPSTILLLGTGVIGLGVIARRRMCKK